MGKTAIEYVDESSNPLRVIDRETGRPGWACVKVSPGCQNCYAERINQEYARRGRRFGTGRPYTKVGLQHVEMQLVGKELLRWQRMRETKRIFVCDMTDLFGEWVPHEYREKIFDAMEAAERQRFLVLTKRAQLMHDWLNDRWGTIPAPNIHVGVSIEDQKRAFRIRWLQKTTAMVRWVSAEPLLSRLSLVDAIEIDRYAWDDLPDDEDEPEEFMEECELECDWINFGNDLVPNPAHKEWMDWRERQAKGITFKWYIDWVVAGGESGSAARPMNPDWVRALRDECTTYGVPFFFKQWGAYAPAYELDHDPDLQARILLGEVPYHEFLEGIGGEREVYRVGKKVAGRLLDGEEWNQLPDMED